MLLLGIDLGTSSIKVSVFDTEKLVTVAQAQYPDNERSIISKQQGWAEQSPEQWWSDVKSAIQKANACTLYNPKDIGAIGIAYQMHGLVCIDKDLHVLRDSIIWCDSRAVPYGEKAFTDIGEQQCLSCLLNSPGNFTAAKLAWVKENEPAIYRKIVKIMLPGDFISMKLTGEVSSSVSSLSEGIFWDFKNDSLSKEVLDHFGFDKDIIPDVKEVFSEHGLLTEDIANELSLRAGIPVTYKAGDQPNNALSLNVLEPGEVAATAGTSGVIYGVSDQLTFDKESRVNTFAHVNYSGRKKSLGVLLCINGVGILNNWMKNVTSGSSYKEMDMAAAKVQPGSGGVCIIPFGNGAERMLQNKNVGAHIHGIDFNMHQTPHLLRAAQEGVAFAFRYGLDILRENGMHPAVIRAGRANMFQSKIFTDTFVNTTNIPIQLYENDGSVGAAIGAGIGAHVFSSSEAFKNLQPIEITEPSQTGRYEEFYNQWKHYLLQDLAASG
ncbi:FGGY-family carbohydrate kinase [soil metagenome]